MQLDGGDIRVIWDEISKLELHVFLVSKTAVKHRCLKFVLDAVVSPTGTAAVIDGCRLLLTPFRSHITCFKCMRGVL